MISHKDVESTPYACAVDTPTMDSLKKSAPEHWRTVHAHGHWVGLPTDEDMGNSEVGRPMPGSDRACAQQGRDQPSWQSVAVHAMWPDTAAMQQIGSSWQWSGVGFAGDVRSG